MESSVGFHDCGFVATVLFAFVSYLSPIVFIVIPKLLWMNDSNESGDPLACGTACKVRPIQFIGIGIKHQCPYVFFRW